jgi:uncharacterized membrane protein (GlpM family)
MCTTTIGYMLFSFYYGTRIESLGNTKNMSENLIGGLFLIYITTVNQSESFYISIIIPIMIALFLLILYINREARIHQVEQEITLRIKILHPINMLLITVFIGIFLWVINEKVIFGNDIDLVFFNQLITIVLLLRWVIALIISI